MALRTKRISTHASGIRVAASTKPVATEAVSEIREALAGWAPQHLIIFFDHKYDAQQLSTALARSFPGTTFSGCSTAGEISPAGMSAGSVVVIAFPKNGFRIFSQTIENLCTSSVDRASQAARQLKARFDVPKSADEFEKLFGILLVDGLSSVEEQIVAAINWALGDIQLVGGSAGDNLAFKKTVLISNGRVLRNAAVLIVTETDVPFRVFKTQNFNPTETKLVVTDADPERRIVYELNAEPAAQEYAKAIGLLPNDLGPFSFASYPLGVNVGGDYYCRSIRNINEDGSLSFFCAIDEGLVFTVARPNDILQSTRTSLENIDEALNGIDMVIGFECILRRLDAESRQVRRQLAQMYRDFGIVGFQTYGEQYNAMHLNQTLTGIAFGANPQTTPANVATVADKETGS